MKTLTLALTLSVIAASPCAFAATGEHDMSQHQMAMQPASPAKADGTGVLKEVDAKGSRLKIAHEPINALHWPPMTMWFAVKGTIPEGLKAGDRVHFELEQIQQDQWVISRIERKH